MESKKVLREKLKRQGYWDDYVAYREELKKQGHSPKDADKEARAKFSALAENPKPADRDDAGTSGVCADVFADKPHVNARKVVNWVFDHIDVADVEPSDAPSAGAWSLLQRVRKHPDLLKEFYRTIWAKMLPTRSEIEATEKFEDDGRQQLHVIAQIRRAVGGDSDGLG